MAAAVRSRSECRLDGIDHAVRLVVFPEPEDAPPGGLKCGRLSSVSGLVVHELLVPVLGIRCRPRAMVGTPMPEATIDEDGDPRSREHDVGPDRPVANDADWIVDPKSEAAAVKQRPDGQFRLGIASPIRTHDSAPPVWRVGPLSRAARCSTLSLTCVSSHLPVRSLPLRACPSRPRKI